MNIPQKYCNPVDLMLAAPVGECIAIHKAKPEDKIGYCEFSTHPAGWRAAHRQIEADQKRGKTVRQFLSVFAPKTENDTEKYIKFFCDEMRCKDSDLLSSFSKYAIAGVMAEMEGYYAQ